MNKTGIEFLDYTWNPVTGCTPVSAGCRNCWAKRMHARAKTGKPFSEVTLHSDRLEEPLRRRKPARIGVSFMGDLFHERVGSMFIRLVWETMEKCPQHTFLILTKRPERMHEDLRNNSLWNFGKMILPNVWLGLSVSNQEDADKNIPLILRMPAALRYVSYEPGLGSIDVSEYLAVHKLGIAGLPDWTENTGEVSKLDWVIAGGESGPGARPLHPDWVRRLRDQCQAAGVPFFMKQMSGRAPIPEDLQVREFPNANP